MKRFLCPRIVIAFVLLSILALPGCQSFGPKPATVASVDVTRYMGLWYEIASNPQFFNDDLVAVTAQYTLRDDGKVTVLNKGHKNTPAGEEESIEGVASVVDKATNSKLAVTFPSVPFTYIFKGEYWIVALGQEYDYAVVTDSKQSSLFILYREASMPREKYDALIAELQQKSIDTSRLRITGQIAE